MFILLTPGCLLCHFARFLSIYCCVATSLAIYRSIVVVVVVATRYVSAVARDTPRIDRILLLCKSHLIPFYTGCGFSLVGRSAVEHGQDTWFEMIRLCSGGRAQERHRCVMCGVCAVCVLCVVCCGVACMCTSMCMCVCSFCALPRFPYLSLSRSLVSLSLSHTRTLTSPRFGTVDAFSRAAYQGNPAAVVVLPAASSASASTASTSASASTPTSAVFTAVEDEAWMKSVAGEFNLSETAFVQLRGANGEESKEEAKGGDAAATAPVHASIRWFTPTVEVDLCGHATLGASHMLWDDGHVDIDRDIHFSSNSGLLVAKRRRDPVRYV